ncbi:hypothetical protein ABIE33_006814 [Ensifer sp. 4252]
MRVHADQIDKMGRPFVEHYYAQVTRETCLHDGYE